MRTRCTRYEAGYEYLYGPSVCRRCGWAQEDHHPTVVAWLAADVAVPRWLWYTAVASAVLSLASWILG